MLSGQQYLIRPHQVDLATIGRHQTMRGEHPAYGGDAADRKPSRLEQMRADYQRKLLKEKEEKMIQAYEDNQRKAMVRITRNGSAGAGSDLATPHSGKSVRDFFNERRKLESKGAPVPPIDNHYRLVKGEAGKKLSAGRDRSQPLAPLHRLTDEQTGGGKSGIPLRKGQHGQGDENPFSAKPRMVKHAPLPPTHPPPTQTDNNNNGGRVGARHHSANRPAERLPSGGEHKLTDFQKWQLEQNKTREKRLQKMNSKKHELEPEERGFGSRPPTGDTERIKELEKQLLDKIAREQAALRKLQIEREREEEERKELERRKKREEAERARQKKLEEAERARQKKLEEEKRKEEEKARRHEEAARKKLVPETYEDSQDEEEPPQRTQLKSSKYSTPKQPTPSRSKVKLDEHEEEHVPSSDANYYLQAATSSEATGFVGSLAKCAVCGRSFAQERLRKHQDACAKANKPRKEFDSSKKRVEGTELAKYAGKSRKPEPPKKKSNWRAHHEQFIESLRYAKKVTQIEKEGGDLRSLAPPPTTVDPDLVPCPHCGRTFNETAAERHIPRCQALKTRPAPSNTRRK
ncbi:zinc finger C2HC domain-containing protein 1C-like [Physella acuta]|uniref:zinc finger C2HC domain-containing protein 1C-like n=1 Tax=Physella acuta TaxID=109671 RepID=UPI0027DABF50|nr:zinc finger C2HC domain-containing protein 1C-like [Physella acuta]